VPHPLVLGLYSTPSAAAAGARALHALGVARDQISVVSRNHDEEGALAEQMDASPGADIEDSRPAARLGELGGQVLAAIALVMPGIGRLRSSACSHVVAEVAKLAVPASVVPLNTTFASRTFGGYDGVTRPSSSCLTKPA